MKKIQFFCFVFFSCIFSVSGQEISVIRQTQLIGKAEGQFFFPQFSPDGNNILVSTENYKGLKIYNRADKSLTTISESEGAGYEPLFSPDSKNVYYRENTSQGLLKYSSLNEYRLSKRRKVVVEKKKRDLSSAQIVNNQLLYSIGNTPKKSKISGLNALKSAQAEIYIRIENLKVVLYQNGERKELPLNGDGNYIWASLSPDQQKILYNYNGRSTYLADLSGNVMENLGKLNAPQWIDNNWIVGMNDKDNGHEVISSDILAVSADGKIRKNLTNTSDQMEMYPQVSADGKLIVFHTTRGEIFALELDVK